MKKQLFFIAGLLAYMGCASQTKLNCTPFKTGSFSYEDSLHQTILVTRTEKTQTEVNSATHISTRFSIKWLDDCSYRLKQVWSSDKASRKKFRNSTSDVVITKTAYDRYEYTCACKDSVHRVSGVMLRM